MLHNKALIIKDCWISASRAIKMQFLIVLFFHFSISSSLSALVKSSPNEMSKSRMVFFAILLLPSYTFCNLSSYAMATLQFVCIFFCHYFLEKIDFDFRVYQQVKSVRKKKSHFFHEQLHNIQQVHLDLFHIFYAEIDKKKLITEKSPNKFTFKII